MNNQPYTPTDQQTLLKVFNVLIAVATVACILFIFLIYEGYGTVQFVNLPGNTKVQINGHTVNSTSIKLRPGTYQFVISSPTTSPLETNISVGLLQTVALQPKLQPRDPDAILSSTIGSVNGTTKVPQLNSVNYFENQTWLVGYITNGSSAIALHYNSQRNLWEVKYYNTNGYPNDKSALPSDVSNEVTQLESHHV